MVGNDYCNDETNTANCNYDGGDCCILNTNTTHCSDCACHIQETCQAGNHPLYTVGNGYCDDNNNVQECNYDGGDCCLDIGNGYCDDQSNTPMCNYDGGDCCGSCVNKAYCYTCDCLDRESSNGIANSDIGNSLCEDGLNNAECQFDGRDCCGSNVNTDHCTVCQCQCIGIQSQIADRYCDDINNNEAYFFCCLLNFLLYKRIYKKAHYEIKKKIISPWLL